LGSQYRFLSLYLGVSDKDEIKDGSSRYAKFQITALNQLDINNSISKGIFKLYKIDIEKRFNKEEKDWGFTNFLPLDLYYDRSSGFFKDNNLYFDIIISVEDKPHLLIPTK
jgi:hypothetical protein